MALKYVVKKTTFGFDKEKASANAAIGEPRAIPNARRLASVFVPILFAINLFLNFNN